jgi:hypothetical protein
MPSLVTRGATMRDGSVVPVEVRAYADPDLEAVRASITDTATEQVGGRGRGINRTAANPLDWFLLAGDVLAPLPLDTLTTWQDVAPGPSARMAARGVVLTSPSDAARAYPDLFQNPEAAKKALQREAGTGGYFRDKSLWEVFIGECPRNIDAWPLVQYRPAGRGQQTRTAQAHPDRLPDLRPWLETAADAPLTLYAPPEQPETTPMQPPQQVLASPALRLARASLALDKLRPDLSVPASIHTPPRAKWWLDPELRKRDEAVRWWEDIELAARTLHRPSSPTPLL